MLSSRQHRLLTRRICHGTAMLIALALATVVPLSAAETGETRDSQSVPEVPEVDPEIAEPESEAPAFPEGLIQFQQGHYEKALSIFQRFDTSVARYYTGLCLMKLNRPVEAVNQLRTVQAEANPPAKLPLDLGIALLESGETAEAVTLLTDYVQSHPEDADARNQLDAAIRSTNGVDSASSQPVYSPSVAGSEMFNPAPERNWNLSLLHAYEYDSNLVLAPEFSGLGSGIQREDSRWLTALNGDYRLFQESDTVVGLLGSAFQTAQFAMKEFNVSHFNGGVYANQLLSEDLLGGVNYQYHKTLLSGDHFAGEHRLVASLTCFEGEDGHSTLYYEYDHSDVDAPALIPAQERSGDVNRAGMTQAIYTQGGLGRVFTGFQYSYRDAEGSDFDFGSYLLTGRIEIPILDRNDCQTVDSIVDAEVRYFFDDYRNPNSLDFFGRPREDHRVEVRAGVQKYLSEYLSLRIDYTYTDSRSNVSNLFGVEFYSYARHILSTQLIYDF